MQSKLTDQILRDVSRLANDAGPRGYVYATGFLASYLASLAEQDPYVYKQFKRHVEQVLARDQLK